MPSQNAPATPAADAIPRVAYVGVAGGLLLMAFFTLLWASWLFGTVSPAIATPVFAAYAVFAIVFVVVAVRLFGSARRAPTIDTDERIGRTTSIGRQFGIIFGIEFVLIGAAGGILSATGNSDYLNPVIALIVGAHFIPLARVFERTIDYYIAAWTILFALLGIALLLFTSTPRDTVWTIVALAAANGTTAYGVYMLVIARRLTRRQAALTRGSMMP